MNLALSHLISLRPRTANSTSLALNALNALRAGGSSRALRNSHNHGIKQELMIKQMH